MRGRIPLVPALVLLLALPFPCRADDPTPLDRALKAFEKGDYGAAVVEALEVPEKDPGYARAQYLVGESWLALGEFADAEKVFRALLASRAESVPLLTGLGRALAGLEKHDAAEEVLKKARKLEPRNPAPRRALGECLAAQGKPQEARKELEAAQKLDPRDPLTARLLVEVTVKAGDTGSAARAAEAFQKADRDNPLGDFLRALVHERAGSPREAMAGYEEALKKDPKFLDAHKNLAILLVGDNPGYRDKEKSEKALRHFALYFELGGKDEALEKVHEKLKAVLEEGEGR